MSYSIKDNIAKICAAGFKLEFEDVGEHCLCMNPDHEHGKLTIIAKFPTERWKKNHKSLVDNPDFPQYKPRKVGLAIRLGGGNKVTDLHIHEAIAAIRRQIFDEEGPKPFTLDTNDIPIETTLASPGQEEGAINAQEESD